MDEARLSEVAKPDVALGPRSFFKRRPVERFDAAALSAFGGSRAWAWLVRVESGVKPGVVKRRGARLVSLLKSEAR